ncbi:unnamed protein product [Lactuca virosa]|uniref:Non-specific lipid-transfer protein n=1 Tax=Lactuca virosa TaxID=75947 RepID=A0AAU9MT30_9ASTR|nr:unnamed protein product [Lactuca virosa]
MVASQCSGPAVGIAFSPCLGFLDNKEPKALKVCCSGHENLYKRGKTKEDRVAICNCLKTLLENHDRRRFLNIREQCHIDKSKGLGIPDVGPTADCSKISPTSSSTRHLDWHRKIQLSSVTPWKLRAKKTEVKKFESGRKMTTPMVQRKEMGSTMRYSLRSSWKENKKPPLGMSFDRSMEGTMEKKTIAV